MVPLIGAISAFGLLNGVRRRDDPAPIRFAALIFAAAFGTLACSFWPYMIPFGLTVDQAAAPSANLAFMFWGAGLFVMSVTLAYAFLVHWLFRGKVVEEGYEQKRLSRLSAQARAEKPPCWTTAAKKYRS